jgi:protein TonB
MGTATMHNLIAWSLQVAAITVAAQCAISILRVQLPAFQYGYWRAVLALCALLPVWQPRRPAVASTAAVQSAMSIAPALPSATASASAAGIDWSFLAAGVLVIVAALRAGWILVGWVRLRRLHDAGDAVDATAVDAVFSAAAVRADIRYTDLVAQPVTFGLLRPVILLPAALRGQTAAIRDAVVLHELLHVRRRDWAWLVAEELLRAALWFHPAIWWLVSRVQLAREQIVDATVVAMTGRRRDYVEALLAFSDAMPLAPASAFIRRRQLFRRIVTISREDVMSARRLVASAVVIIVAVASAALAAGRLLPLQAAAVLQDQPGPLEQAARVASATDPIPVRLEAVSPAFPLQAGDDVSAQLTFRVVVDAGGSVAELRILGVDLALEDVTLRMSSGGRGLENLLQGLEKAQLRGGGGVPIDTAAARAAISAFADAAVAAIQQWRYEPPRAAPLAFDVVINFGSRGAVTDRVVAPIARMTADGAVRVGNGIKTPTKIKDARPIYPDDAKAQRVQGVVILEIRILADGRVGDARVLRSIPLLDAAALDAVRQWEFTPTLLNGVATPVIMTVTIQFSL